MKKKRRSNQLVGSEGQNRSEKQSHAFFLAFWDGVHEVRTLEMGDGYHCVVGV